MWVRLVRKAEVMSTSKSPLSKLKKEASAIAVKLKAMERGEEPEMVAAREKPFVKFGLVMDDKVLMIELPWSMIELHGEVSLAEFLVKHMRGQRNDA
jgi:hypothetical protein